MALILELALTPPPLPLRTTSCLGQFQALHKAAQEEEAASQNKPQDANGPSSKQGHGNQGRGNQGRSNQGHGKGGPEGSRAAKPKKKYGQADTLSCMMDTWHVNLKF